MWRRTLKPFHPDLSGSHEHFVWLQALRESVCGAYAEPKAEPKPTSRRHRPSSADDPNRVPFDPFADFGSLTDRAVAMADAVAQPYSYLLGQLSDCHAAADGGLYDQQCRGATYKQLAAIGHQVGMSGAERAQWYDICRSVPLSQRHAGHILSRLKRRAA
jgi:hypothetical protein